MRAAAAAPQVLGLPAQLPAGPAVRAATRRAALHRRRLPGGHRAVAPGLRRRRRRQARLGIGGRPLGLWTRRNVRQTTSWFCLRHGRGPLYDQMNTMQNLVRPYPTPKTSKSEAAPCINKIFSCILTPCFSCH